MVYLSVTTVLHYYYYWHRFSSADLTNLVAEAVNNVRGERIGRKVLEKMEASEKVDFKGLLCMEDCRPINDVN